MEIFKVIYDRGWFPGLLQYPVEFRDEGIIFYDRKKVRHFIISYNYIEFCDIDYMLFQTVNVSMWLKSNPLKDIDAHNAEEITKWFPPSAGTGLNLLGNKDELLYIDFMTNFKYAKDIDTMLLSKNVYIRISVFRKPDINHINKPLNKS